MGLLLYTNLCECVLKRVTCNLSFLNENSIPCEIYRIWKAYWVTALPTR